MAPARVIEEDVPWTSQARQLDPYDGPPRNVAYIDNIQFDNNLQPENYEIQGTHADSKILFLDVNILDATGRLPYRGDVYIEGTICPPVKAACLILSRTKNQDRG